MLCVFYHNKKNNDIGLFVQKDTHNFKQSKSKTACPIFYKYFYICIKNKSRKISLKFVKVVFGR